MGQLEFLEKVSSVMYLNIKLCHVKYEVFLCISLLKAFVYQKFNSFFTSFLLVHPRKGKVHIKH